MISTGKEILAVSPVIVTFLLLVPSTVLLRDDAVLLKGRQGPQRNIQKFFNTSETTWTFITTENSKIECKMDVTLDMNDTFVMFQTAFSIKGFRANVTNLGKFEKLDVKEKNDTTFNAIILSNPGRKPYGREHLLFQSRDNTCGVFLVAVYEPAHEWYEMRVRNSTLRRPRLPCVMHFLKTIRRKGKRRPVYTQGCQKICYPRPE
uniref:Putative group i salivary lipocalin n=1 Tax=Rhipicephalus pulchellus TaxID=72859 RepID=L7LS04_RHIPC